MKFNDWMCFTPTAAPFTPHPGESSNVEEASRVLSRPPNHFHIGVGGKLGFFFFFFFYPKNKLN